MVQALSFEDVLRILYMYKVRVRGDSLIVTGGERFPVHVRGAIYNFKPEILEVYQAEEELMAEIDAMEERAQKAEDGDLLAGDPLDLWSRYFALSESLKFYLPKPWVIIPEDEKRCSFCPNLGKPVVEGVLCDYECKLPY